jgi:putative transposase
MFRNFKYRLWTTSDQERELEIMLESHRRLYNEVLSLKQMAYQTAGVTVSKFDFNTWFSKQRPSHRHWMRLNVGSARKTIERVCLAFDGFFRRVKAGQKPGYPRSKGYDHFGSFTFGFGPNGRADGVKLAGDRLHVQHVGTIRVKLHRPVEGCAKTATLKREAGKWYVVFACDLGDAKAPASALPAVGVDVGLESFLTTSDGEKVASPRFLKHELPDLRRKGRAVSRKKKGGSNRRKAAKRLARVHAKVSNLRKEHHHQAATSLIRRYGLIAVECLSVKNMLGNRRLSRAIADAGWSGFIGVLKCKAESAGASVVEVDPRGTSQECSGCGKVVRKDLKVRRHRCPHCNLDIDRDHNAAINILARARPDRAGPAGLNVAAREHACPEKPPLAV